MQQKLLDDISNAFASSTPFCELLGLQVTAIDNKKATMKFSMKNELVGNPLNGSLHGGVTASALDSVGGLLAIAAVINQHADASREECIQQLMRTSTISFTINYLNLGKGETFYAHAETLHPGRRVYHARTKLVNEDDVLIADGTGVYLIG